MRESSCPTRLYRLSRHSFPRDSGQFSRPIVLHACADVACRYPRFAPPFGWHDWVVCGLATQNQKKVRYIVDYYSLRKGIDQDLEFYLDIRPAMDSPSNIKLRIMAMLEDIPLGTIISMIP